MESNRLDFQMLICDIRAYACTIHFVTLQVKPVQQAGVTLVGLKSPMRRKRRTGYYCLQSAGLKLSTCRKENDRLLSSTDKSRKTTGSKHIP